MKNKYGYRTKKELEGLRWAAMVVDFGVSLTVTVALNELTTAYVLFRERHDLCRQRVKQLANIAMEAGSRRKGAMYAVMRNRGFFDTYSDKVIDLAEQDITMFRIGIKQELDNHRHPDSELVSYMETARTMLEMAAVHYDEIMKSIRLDFGYNFGKRFSEFNCRDVLEAWDKVCDAVYAKASKIDLNTERNIALFNNVANKFADGDYIDECMKDAAEEFPEFVEEIAAINYLQQKQMEDKKNE